MNDASQRIEKIKSVFLDTQLFFAKQDNLDALVTYLENTEPTYRSIAYESASMAIALKCLEDNQDLNPWLFFAKVPAMAHEAQVYIGLGWAIAKLNIPFLSVVEKIETRFYHRVADGCGYYDGSFRHRQTVINQQTPLYLAGTALPIYDQGIGRSLWYTCNADIKKIKMKVAAFPAGRHADLWRGIGIAVAYVGGCEDDTLKILLQYASTNSIQLTCGAALASRSRMQANTMTTDTDHCCRVWFELTAGEVHMFSLDPIDPAHVENEAVYFNWITGIEEGLANSFERGSL